jgi:hypothetical protein
VQRAPRVQHYERLVAAGVGRVDSLASFDALVRIALTIAAATTTGAIGALVWSAARSGRGRRARGA